MSLSYNSRLSAAGRAWVVDAGTLEYKEAWALQERLVQRRIDGDVPDLLLFVEHPPVFTIGRSARENHVHVGEETLGRMGIGLVRTNRGGDVTYHGPGQIVGYPILALAEGERDIHAYMRGLEETIIRAIAQYGLAGERAEGMTGVWVGGAKVAAIGVAARRWVTYHGFALNVDPDMSHFEMITPCGLTGKSVTSLRLLTGRQVDIEEVKGHLVRSFGEVFGRSVAGAPEGGVEL